MDLFTKVAARLSEIYKNHETRIESDNGIDYFVIVNPYYDENIRVSCEDGIIFFFSYQHAHFDYCGDFDEDINCLVEYINDFLDGKQVAIEFFHEKENLFGGSRNISEIDSSSGVSLLKSFSGDNDVLFEALFKQIQGADCRCSMRGWSSAHNKDIKLAI